MGVRIQELPETTGINKEDLLIVEDGQGTKKGTVQQLDEALGVSQLKEDIEENASNITKNANNIKILQEDLSSVGQQADDCELSISDIEQCIMDISEVLYQ